MLTRGQKHVHTDAAVASPQSRCGVWLARNNTGTSGCFQEAFGSQAWRLIPVILALGRLSSRVATTSLDYMARPCLKIKIFSRKF